MGESGLENQRFEIKVFFFSPKKSAFSTKTGHFFAKAFLCQNVSEKGVFFRLGNADMSYLIYLSAGTGTGPKDILGYVYIGTGSPR